MFIDFFFLSRYLILYNYLTTALLLVNQYLVFSPCFSLTAHLFQLAEIMNVFIDKLFGILRGLRKVLANFFNNNILSYKTQFYKHYLQYRSHYHALLTEKYLCYLQCGLLMLAVQYWIQLFKGNTITLQATYTTNNTIRYLYCWISSYLQYVAQNPYSIIFLQLITIKF